MSKVQQIRISNFKSVADYEADFKGCTAIITGGNNTGKTSFLRGIPDRIRFVRPDVMVKKGEKEGKGEMTLDSGERFIWEFDVNGKDKLTLITTDGIKQSVTTEIGRRFFPSLFDIDKFLQSPPKAQVKQLQQIVGIDFTDVDERFLKAYAFRTERNREAELYHLKLEKMLKVPEVKPVDLTALQAKKEAERNRLNKLYLSNKKQNDEARSIWLSEKERINRECAEHNEAQRNARDVYEACDQAFITLAQHGYVGDVPKFIESLKSKILNDKEPAKLYPAEPTYIQEMPDSSELDKIDAAILKASETNAAAAKYKEYVDHKAATENAKEIAREADMAVKAIEEERRKMIESANLPKGVTFGPDGILVDGFPLDKSQISTSKLYCAALRIASMNLGQVKTLYFDASFLDRNSLSEIQEWAEANDLQLLIERPDYDAGELRYELIES